MRSLQPLLKSLAVFFISCAFKNYFVAGQDISSITDTNITLTQQGQPDVNATIENLKGYFVAFTKRNTTKDVMECCADYYRIHALLYTEFAVEVVEETKLSFKDALKIDPTLQSNSAIVQKYEEEETKGNKKDKTNGSVGTVVVGNGNDNGNGKKPVKRNLRQQQRSRKLSGWCLQYCNTKFYAQLGCPAYICRRRNLDEMENFNNTMNNDNHYYKENKNDAGQERRRDLQSLVLNSNSAFTSQSKPAGSIGSFTVLVTGDKDRISGVGNTTAALFYQLVKSNVKGPCRKYLEEMTYEVVSFDYPKGQGA